MKNHFILLCRVSAIALALTAPHTAFAQTVDELAAQEAERLNREQQIRQNEQRMQDEKAARGRTQIEVPLPVAPKGKSASCRNIKTITLKDANLIPEKKQQEIIKPFENRCLGVNEIQQLLADITGYYITNGYAASRAYIPEQDLASGKLLILVVEGTVKKVKLEDGGKRSINMAGAFPDIEGKPLNLRDFEQGLDQVNRLSTNNATLDIQPGDQPGESVVLIKNQPKFPVGVSLTSDSYGSRGTGRYQVGATVTSNNVAGLNEMLSYTRRQSVPFYDFNQNSDSDSVFLSIPYGRALMSFGYSDSNYESQLITPGGTVLALEGNNRNIYAKLDRNLWRSQTDKWNISVMMTQKNSNNFAAGQKLGVSSRTLSVMDLDTDYSTPAMGGLLSVNGGVAFGMPLFGALNDQPQLSGDAPKAQFTKFKFATSLMVPFEALKRSATFSTALSAQYSLDTLYGSEQISVGGPYSVRGFYGTSIANDHGYYLRNDLSFLQPLGAVMNVPVTLKPYIALDVGSVGGVAEKTPNGTLMGGAIGFSIFGGPASFDIFTAKGFAHPAMIRDEGMNSFARATLSF